MPTKVEKDAITGRETTGHEWDGLRELDTPLPKWWLWTFYATIAFAIGYSVVYPAVPWVNSHTKGLFGYTNRAALTEDLSAAAAKQATIRQQIAAASLDEIRATPELFNFALVGGRVAFAENCAACHRSGGAGAKGFPNLADDDWLWGGSLEQIHQTISFGIRNPNPESRQGQMPKFEGVLTNAQIDALADYAISLADGGKSGEAQKLFADNCAACHGDKGQGSREVGAPQLADKIWLYGGDKATVRETILKGRTGSMPAWAERLDEATLKLLAVYVHALGGGEK